MTEEKRESALLTPSQRDALSEDNDITERGMRSARARIRDRIKNGLLDFRLIFDHLAEDDRDALQDAGAHERAMLHDGMVAATALFYEIHDREGWSFQEFLERAVEDAHRDNKRSPERMIVEGVEFDVSLRSPRSREEIERSALQKFTRGHELTDREYRVLTEPEGWIVNPDTGLHLPREEILETLRDRRRERGRERQLEEAMDQVNADVEMFGEGYQVPADVREELEEDLEE